MPGTIRGWLLVSGKKPIEPERIRPANANPVRSGRYVLYWMQAAQRAEWNPALTLAIALGNERKLPVVVGFGLTTHYPEANLRHYAFMLQGLREVRDQLAERRILFVVQVGSPPKVALQLAQNAAALVMDFGYLRHQRAWRAEVAQEAPCLVLEVESEVVVPVWLAYPKEAWSAQVLRRRIFPFLERFLRPHPELEPEKSSLGMDLPGLDLGDPAVVLAGLPLDRSVPPVELPSGTEAARARLLEFLEKKLSRYPEERNNPAVVGTSGLSPYLHFGQISPVEVAWRVAQMGGPGAQMFLEELIVRRELAMNYVFYNPNYDRFEGLPVWAKETLRKHAADPRSARYTLEELEGARTEDPLWNAAQTELLCTGRIHGYMRMYWGKQFIRWTEDPEEAFRFALYLNDKYALDGRDPNSYAGVGWCFGLHDRPFPERPVFGKVRPMTGEGLRRKFSLETYLARWGKEKT